jgi:hypothetical protein
MRSKRTYEIQNTYKYDRLSPLGGNGDSTDPGREL